MKNCEFLTVHRMQVQPMEALRNRVKERKGRTLLHLSVMYPQRLGRKWNGCTNFACQTIFTISGTSVSSCLLKAQGVCYKFLNSYSLIHWSRWAVVWKVIFTWMWIHMNTCMSLFNKMPSEKLLDLSLLGLLTSSLKGTSPLQTFSPTTTCTAGTSTTPQSFRP